jgi:hypothetical protein
VLLAVAALLLAFAGWLIMALQCDEQPYDCVRATVDYVQLGIALVGIIPALCLVVATMRRNSDLAAFALAVTLGIYGCWFALVAYLV